MRKRYFGKAGFWESEILGKGDFGKVGFWEREILGKMGFGEKGILGIFDIGIQFIFFL